MSFLPKRVLDKLKSAGYKPNSITTYNCSVKRIYRDIFKKNKYAKVNLSEFDEIKKGIDKIDNIGVRKSLVGALLAIIKAENLPKKLQKQYGDYFDSIVLLYDDKNLYKKASKKDLSKKNEVGSMKKLSEKRESLLKCAEDSKSNRDWTKYLVSCLYTYLPPLRQDEYIDMVIVSLPKDPDYKEYCLLMKGVNFMDFGNDKIVICKSKTAKKYKVRIFDLPKDLKEAIQKVRSEMNEKSKKLLNGDMFNTQPGFSLFLKRTLGASSSGLRKIYISDMMREFDTRKKMMDPKNIEKRKKIAYIMGHSITTATMIYDRFT